MARNGSGTYSTPAGQPVVAGTTITAAAHNDLVNDIVTEITDSLSRSGKGGMLAVLKAVDGAVGGPAFSFNSEATSGIYRAGAGDLRLAILGALIQKWTATGAAITGDLTVSGAVAAATVTAGGSALSTDAWTNNDAGVTAAANWTIVTKRLRKASNGLVFLTLGVTTGAAAGATITTLPAGYRPGANVGVACCGYGGAYIETGTIYTTGVVEFGNTRTEGREYNLSACFLAE